MLPLPAALALLLLSAPAVAEPPCHGRVDDRMACAQCHRAVHDEWTKSAHARAYVDPWFVKALQSRAEPERCIPCHAPAAVLDRLGQMPKARSEAREHGVDCRSCHVRGETVHGPEGMATTAHATERDPTFSANGSVALCTSCHDMRIADVLPLGREFERARDGDDDATCVSCHMESVRRAPAEDPKTGVATGAPRPGRSHALLGPSDPEFCASAFLFELVRTESARELVLRCGAGHGVPGLARMRAFEVRIELQSKSGQTLHQERAVLSGRNRLLVDEERRWRLPAPSGAVALRVRVDHIFADQKPTTVVDRTWELP